jgi:hypothetical protein
MGVRLVRLHIGVGGQPYVAPVGFSARTAALPWMSDHLGAGLY